MILCENICGQQICLQCQYDNCTSCFVHNEHCFISGEEAICLNCEKIFCPNHSGLNQCCSQCGTNDVERKKIWHLFLMHLSQRVNNGKKSIPIDMLKIIFSLL
jgi:hypothetical protein